MTKYLSQKWNKAGSKSQNEQPRSFFAWFDGQSASGAYEFRGVNNAMFYRIHLSTVSFWMWIIGKEKKMKMVTVKDLKMLMMKRLKR